MAVTGYGTITSMKDIAGGGALAHPHDSVLEVIEVSSANGTTVTLGTGTDVIGRAAFAIPVSRKTTAPSATAVSTCETTLVLRGGADVHDVYVIGGAGLAVAGQSGTKKFNSFALPAFEGAATQRSDLIWEMVRTPMGGESPALIKITAASSLQYIKRIAYAFAVEVAASAPTATGGIGVKELTSIDVTFIAANGVTGDILCFIGGYAEGSTVADDTGTLDGADYYMDKAFRLPNRYDPLCKTGLVFEVVNKTLDGASPATVTITAATDCQHITHIEAVIPVSTKTSGQAVSWSGGVGATSAIYAANGASDVIRCLVIGR